MEIFHKFLSNFAHVDTNYSTNKLENLTRGRTDHFAASVTYLQFPIISAFLRRRSASRHCELPGFPNFIFTFSRKGTFLRDLQLWHMTLTYKLDIDMVKIKHRAKRISQRSFSSRVMVRWRRQTDRQTDRHTHSHTADRLYYTVIGR